MPALVPLPEPAAVEEDDQRRAAGTAGVRLRPPDVQHVPVVRAVADVRIGRRGLEGRQPTRRRAQVRQQTSIRPAKMPSTASRRPVRRTNRHGCTSRCESSRRRLAAWSLTHTRGGVAANPDLNGAELVLWFCWGRISRRRSGGAAAVRRPDEPEQPSRPVGWASPGNGPTPAGPGSSRIEPAMPRSISHAGDRRPIPASRPATEPSDLEPLESRRLLATFTVTNTLDDGNTTIHPALPTLGHRLLQPGHSRPQRHRLQHPRVPRLDPARLRSRHPDLDDHPGRLRCPDHHAG